jgi:ribulose-phosphate 3-epimerase
MKPDRIIISPSVLSADFTRLKDDIQAVEAAGADWLHVDVADGHFAPNITMGPFVVEALRRISKLPLDVHLMIQRPERYVEAFAKAGAAWLTVHPEAEGDIHHALDLIVQCGVQPGMSIKPPTPVSAVDPYAKKIKMLMVMTVNPGFSGQKFMAECMPKYHEAREKFGPELLLQIDGGVTEENAAIVRGAGVQVIVAATAVFRSPDYAKAIRVLKGLEPAKP